MTTNMSRTNHTLSALFAVLLGFAMLLPTGAFAADAIAYIGEVGGKVLVVKPASGEDKTAQEATAKAGMFLGAGDTIKTGDESFASVVFQDDGSRVKLGAVSTLTINAVRKQKQLDKSLFMESGKMWAKVTKKRGTEFQVKTPTSVASVKGTRFILEETESGETWVWVLEDAVQLSNESGEVTVNAGQKGKATKDTLDVQEIEDMDLPIEPGPHEIIFFFKRSDGSSLQKELHIEFEK
jgi:hypothetical protein